MTCLQTSFVVLVLSKSESLTLPEYAVGFPGGASGKEPACQCGRHKSRGCGRSVRKIPWRRAWQPTPGLLPGESHEQRSRAGHSSWGHKELDTTEQRSTHTHKARSTPLCGLASSDKLKAFREKSLKFAEEQGNLPPDCLWI